MGEYRCDVIRMRYHCRIGQLPVRDYPSKPSSDYIPPDGLFSKVGEKPVSSPQFTDSLLPGV
jgi:hypothetical protein